MNSQLNRTADQPKTDSRFFESVALAVVIGVAAVCNGSAAPVTFWFSGHVTQINSPTNALPVGIALGTPFSGRITYDTAPPTYQTGSANASGSRSNIYLGSLATASTLLQIGPHTVTNTLITSGNVGSLHINDNLSNEDYFLFYSGQTGLVMDGSPLTNTLWSIYLKDSSRTAYDSADFPTTPPDLAKFQSRREFYWTLFEGENQTDLLFAITGVITSITPEAQVRLQIQPTGPHTAQLAWPVEVNGFTLQATTNLVTGPWHDVPAPVTPQGMQNTVTVSTLNTPKFYRLTK